MNNSIPKDIILTWKHSEIPEYVIDNIRKLYPDFNIKFFSDDDCRNFIKKEYGDNYVSYFNSIQKGYNKGDFFRYCYLYKNGGYYFDIDIEHICSVHNIIEPQAKLFSVISAVLVTHNGKPYPQIFQAVLCAEKNHPVIKKCIDDMISAGPVKVELEEPPFDHSTTHRMFINTFNHLKRMPNHGIINDIQLGIEQHDKNCNRFYCVYGDIKFCFSRYESYKREKGFNNVIRN